MPWTPITNLIGRTYRCGHCGNQVGSDKGWSRALGNTIAAAVYVCSVCEKPTYFADKVQIPGVPFGDQVEHLPADIGNLYKEARGCCATGAYTAAVLLCRKLLMNVAVSQGAEPNKPFVQYVEHLAATGYVPPTGREWVDHIRKKGNEATHEIHVMGSDDARDLITFSEMLLKLVYEFPKRIPPSK